MLIGILCSVARFWPHEGEFRPCINAFLFGSLLLYRPIITACILLSIGRCYSTLAMASLDTKYRSEVLKLCSQIENLRVRSGNLEASRGVDSPGLAKSSSRVPVEVVTNESSCVDENSSQLVIELHKLSIKLNSLEKFLVEDVTFCDEATNASKYITEIILDVKNDFDAIRKNGKKVHDNLIQEEMKLSGEINTLLESFMNDKTLENSDHNTKQGLIKCVNARLREQVCRLSASKSDKKRPSLKLTELTIWDPRDYMLLEKICKNYSDENSMLAACLEKIPHKSESEILIYIRKYQDKVIKRNAIKIKIAQWREAKNIDHESNRKFALNQSHVILNKPVKNINCELRPALKDSIARLSKRPKTAVSKTSLASSIPKKAQQYSAQERKKIKAQLQSYKEDKISKLNNSSKSNRPKTAVVVSKFKLIKEFQDRDKKYLEMRKKTIAELESNKINVKKKLKKTVIERLPNESTLMNPTKAFLNACNPNRCDAQSKKVFTSHLNDVDSIPKRKVPLWQVKNRSS